MVAFVLASWHEREERTLLLFASGAPAVRTDDLRTARGYARARLCRGPIQTPGSSADASQWRQGGNGLEQTGQVLAGTNVFLGVCERHAVDSSTCLPLRHCDLPPPHTMIHWKDSPGPAHPQIA
jgi:hypothetical protein